MGDIKTTEKTAASIGFIKERPFDNILNFRDVGKSINDFLGEKLVVEGRLYRSARPDEATLSDKHLLRDEYNIKTVMDLRTVTEHIDQAQKREAKSKALLVDQSNDAIVEPVKIPGINYLEINVNGKGFERAMLWKLSTWSIAKMFALMALGYRIEAISILAREVMLPRGLVGLGFDSIDLCGPEIAECLRAFTSLPNYGILVHCTQGKDRTGLITALILFLLEIPIEAITNDYLKSEEELQREMESRIVEIRSIGLTEDFARCHKDWVVEMDRHLREKYGGVKEYLKVIGFGEEDQERLLANLKA